VTLTNAGSGGVTAVRCVRTRAMNWASIVVGKVKKLGLLVTT